MMFSLVLMTTNTSLTYASLDNNDNQIAMFSHKPNWRWTNMEIVSSASAGSSSYPDIAVDLAGNVHVVWSDNSNGDYDIFYKKWVASTETWLTTETVSTISTGDSTWPAVDVDSEGNIYVVWADLTNYASSGTDSDIFFNVWDVSASSWNGTEVVSTESTLASTRPAIKVDSSGNAYICWEDQTNYDLSGSDYDIFFKKWISSSQSFTTTEVVSLISSGAAVYSSITADEQGNVYCVWLDQSYRNPDRDLLFNKLDEQSGLWVGTELLNIGSTLDFWSSNDIILDLEGNIHVIAKGESASDQKIIYYKWDVNDEYWSDGKVISQSGDVRDPTIVSDPVGNLYLAWYTYRSSDGDVCFSYFDHSTSSWSSEEIISSTEIDNPDMPALTIDNIGHIHVVWRDTYDYFSSGTDSDIYYRKYIGPPETPKLDPIIPIISETGDINLEWEESYGATEYYIYQSLNPIWSVEDLSPVFTTSDTNATNILLVEDTYYYAVIASNFAGNSSVSNCVFVTYEVPHLREFAITTSIVLGIAIIAIVTTRKWKKK